ncbi:hypothetical protein SNEBB_001670 [Seison nebaliae]|nr:hypothetical protein SNEBB_001670 [Seison nebaliae]
MYSKSLLLFLFLWLWLDTCVCGNIRFVRSNRQILKGKDTFVSIQCADKKDCLGIERRGNKNFLSSNFETVVILKNSPREVEEVEQRFGKDRYTYVDGIPFLIVAQRMRRHIDFEFSLETYKKPFGDSENNWIGLDTLVEFTARNYDRRFRVEVFGIFNHDNTFFEYRGIRVLPQYLNYTLNLMEMKISTMPFDYDFDKDMTNNRPFQTAGNCYDTFHYGFWYGPKCSHANFFSNWNISIKRFNPQHIVIASTMRILLQLL